MDEQQYQILTDANYLRNNNAQKRLITAQLVDILQTIKDDIRDAYKIGAHELTVNLPVIFSIPNMSNSNAQRTIWGNIIDALVRKNYRVKLTPGKDKCVLHITWLSKEDESEIEYQNKVIAQAINKK